MVRPASGGGHLLLLEAPPGLGLRRLHVARSGNVHDPD